MMKVLALRPAPDKVSVVLVEGDQSSFTVPFRAEWPVSDADDTRIGDLCEIRKRIIEHVTQMQPDAICVTPFEPFALTKGKPSMSTFRTAELRGVLLEASHSTGRPTEQRDKKLVNATIGQRKAAQYTDDDAFWGHLGTDFQKKYRDVTLVALSKIRA